MKNPLPLILILFSSCGAPKFTEVSDTEINSSKLELATELTEKILTAQKQAGFYKLTSSEATSEMVSGFTENVQKKSYETISGMFGQFQALKFYQLLRPIDGTRYEVYRFKGQFDSETAQIEIRTVLDGNGKLAGFFIKPWKDNL